MTNVDNNQNKPGIIPRLWGKMRGALGLADQDWRESINDMLEEASEGQSDLSNEEHHMLRNLLGFRDVRVEDVMVPRADITAVEDNISYNELLEQFVECAHSRVPVFSETLDNPVGMVHIKDILPFSRTGAAGFELKSVIRNILFAPPSMPALELLLRMQATHTHMALVIDEYGGTDGLLTIEDLVEEIVGEIEDEHDDDLDDPVIVQKGDDKWEAEARLEVEELEKTLSITLSGTDFDEVDTLGGLAFTVAGRIPQRGEILHCHLADNRHLEMLVREADPRRIKMLEIRLIEDAHFVSTD